MLDDRGKVIKEALPATPVEITGLNDVPVAGDKFMVFESEKQARSVGESRLKAKLDKERSVGAAMSLDDLFSQIKDGEVLDLAVEKDIVDKSGAWYAYKGEKIGQGRENAKRYLIEHPDIMNEITEAIKASLMPGEEEV